MCGLAGLSVGCGVAGPTCPKSLLRARAGTGSLRPASGDRSPLDSWDSRASVRTRPSRVNVAREEALRFPAELVPVVSHPVIRDDRDLCDRVMARQLFRYLQFTAKLEHLVVNRTVLSLAHGLTGVALPDGMALDAYKIYCDEAYHALVAAQLAAEVARQEGFEVGLQSAPFFLRRLAHLTDAAGPELAPLLEILFVVCSETLISRALTTAADASGVSEPIRAALRDHAHDEQRHHAYFAQLLRHLWPQLSSATQRRAGVYVPSLIDAFLLPDFDDMTTELVAHGLPPATVAEVLHDSYPSATVDDDRRNIARHTVRHFADVGALAIPEVAASFRTARLQVDG